MNTRSPVQDGADWTRADFPETRSWVQPLTSEMIAELEGAVAKAMAAGGSPHDLTPQAFDLPVMRPLLEETRPPVGRRPWFRGDRRLPGR